MSRIIFISYRRGDSAAHAGRLYDTLRLHFGDLNVFMDVDAVEPGVDFVARIKHAIARSDVVLAVIGDDWLTVCKSDGTRRIDDPDDLVRLELATAIARDDVRVIPVLVEGAQMPASTELPDTLKNLSHRNAIVLSDTGWRSATAGLIDAIGGQSVSATGASLWVLPGFVGLGGLALVYAGLRAKRKTWLSFGLLYSLPVGVWALASTPQTHLLEALLYGSWFLVWAASLIHVFAIRPQYLAQVGAPISLSATPWVLPSFIGLGGPGLVYAGLRTKKKQWLSFGLLYCIPPVGLSAWSMSQSADDLLSNGLFGSLWFVSWVVSLMHILVIRSQYPGIVKANQSKAE